ncbi:probable alpha-N-arabinofuranosidase / alpha-L-arabinofuranosidase [Phialocephala subalpina]|uniref:Probable alpha-N-arabinofuranosidase / alpha-L-arabinofuranosidase n=1 Tax=Phialocephala subalpina TaxID=576137 RepID=A0A1L7WN72_9HELO|nr:probable alpha-N-arabinofuranosidase / alpha-L-arabinofuranosidase [Phialocephala subalpina]
MASTSLQPLVKEIFTADPSAHVFNGRIYVYPSHDIPTPIQDNDNGDQYAMADYHVLSMDSVGSPVTDHGVVLSLEQIPWASKQLWAPDAAEKNGKFYLFFPARDKEGVFRIGVAVGDKPEGPFTPEKEPIEGSYSIDPASFVDEDGEAYLYFGGIWGGQYLALLDEAGKPLDSSDHDRRFFEAAWMHKYNGKYYFSYSTGDTHYLCYAIGDSPLGPFTYGGRILEPVEGWTTHHSIVEHEGRWWLFHHDTSLSGKNHLRCVKVREIFYDATGKITVTEP